MSSVAPAMRDAIRISSRRSSTLSKAFSLQLVGIEPRFLVDRLDQILADAAFVFLVHLDQDALPRELLVGAQRDELRLAARLHRRERVLVFLPGAVVGVL